MERVQELIDKLWKQHQQQEHPERMLTTVHQLEELLQAMVRKEQTPGGKVAVVMPPKRRPANNTTVVAAQPPAPEVPPVVQQMPAPEPVSKPGLTIPSVPIEPEAAAPVLQPEPLPAPEPAQPAEKQPERLPYILQKPVATEHTPPPPQPPVPDPQPAAPPANDTSREVFHLHFDTTDEAPTLTQQQFTIEQTPRELHEVIGAKAESLNDRLKQEHVELSHRLKETPIKDLRKAIGVNDKFLFVRELFRGDEAMYERSIKTINNFHILPEAEYWISRELKVKLGWDDRADVVQSFYQLVRRRFA